MFNQALYSLETGIIVLRQHKNDITEYIQDTTFSELSTQYGLRTAVRVRTALLKVYGSLPDSVPSLPTIDHTHVSGSAFGIIAAVAKALKRAGCSQELISSYRDQACSDDYDNVIQVSMRYVNFE
jgi:hypothetical protein